MPTKPALNENVRRAGLVLLAIWAVLFVAGAAGEILDIEFLSGLADFRSAFLR